MILSRVNSRNEYADAIEPIDNTSHATHHGSPQSYATNTQNSLPTHLLIAHFSAEEDASAEQAIQGIFDERGRGGDEGGGGGGGYGGDWPASTGGGFTSGEGISGGGLTYSDPPYAGGGSGSAPAYDAGSGSPSGPSTADRQSPPQIVGVITKGPSTNDSNVTTTSGRFPDPVTTAPNGDTAYWGESWTNNGTQVHDYTSVTVQAAPDPNQNAGNNGSSSLSNTLQGAGEMVLGGVGIAAGAGITAIGAAVTAAGLATTEFGVGLIGDALGPVIAAGGLAATAWSANLFTKGVNDYMSSSDGLQGPQTTVITPTPPQPTTNSGPTPDGLQGLPTTVNIPTPPLPNINSGSTPDGLQGPPVVANRAPEWIPPEVQSLIPAEWGDGKATKKGEGWRWTDPEDQGNGVRIDRGDSNNSQISQQPDHVVINSGGQVIGRDGQPLPFPGRIKDNPDLAHIPLEEYKNWRTWNHP